LQVATDEAVAATQAIEMQMRIRQKPLSVGRRLAHAWRMQLLKPHSHCARARAWTHAGPRARMYDHARGRPLTNVAAVARNNANYADTAWYCAILRAVAAKFTQNHAQI